MEYLLKLYKKQYTKPFLLKLSVTLKLTFEVSLLYRSFERYIVLFSPIAIKMQTTAPVIRNKRLVFLLLTKKPAATTAAIDSSTPATRAMLIFIFILVTMESASAPSVTSMGTKGSSLYTIL